MSTEVKKQKRVYKCGKCGNKGHNARTCKGSTAAPVTTVVENTVTTTDDTTTTTETTATADEEPASEPAPKPEPPRVVMSETKDLTVIDRRPTASSNVSPYNCETCGQVGVLVLLELEDGAKALRCEHCMNKVRAKQILTWGAKPGDGPTGAGGGGASRLFR